MENKNTKLKQAFEQIEKQTLADLPKEEQVVRAYSDSFNERMTDILNGTDKNTDNTAKHRRIRWSVLVAAVLMCVLTVSVVAGEMIPVFSEKWRERMAENISNAAVGEGVEEFDAEYEKSTDPFSVVGRERADGAFDYIILDYSKSIKYEDIAREDEEYRFELKSITEGRRKHMVHTGGKWSDGSAKFETVVSDGYYAIIEISRCDGKALTYEEKEGALIDYEWSYLIEGYSPSLTNCHFRGKGAVVRCYDDYKVSYAVEITEMIPFARNDLALAAIDINAHRETNKDTIYADEDGKLELVNEDEYFGVLLRFSVPDEYASDDEHYAEKYFELKPHELKNWMKSYQTNATE